MPSKTNAKGSGAKNQAKPTSQNDAKTGNGSDANTVASTSQQINSKPLPSETRQHPYPPVPEADKTRPDPSQGLLQDTITDHNKEGGGVNKKKQKRRMKEAAKRAAEEIEISREMDKIRNGTFKSTTKQPPTYNGEGQANGYDYEASDYDDQDHYEPDELEYYSDAGVQRNHLTNFRSPSSHLNGNEDHNQDPERDSGGKSKKKRKGKPATTGMPLPPASTLHKQNSLPHPPPPPPPPPPATIGNSYLPSGSHHNHHIQKQHKIWNTSTTEERENIKEFWLSLGEEDRRSLVKVEKEAVLKKMKEQQKYSCSCTVCGRKRTAIEEELEVLYDAYYEELEQYANHQQINLDNVAPIIPQPQLYHPMSRPRQHVPQAFNQSHRARLQELEEGDDPGDLDEESDFGEDDDLSDGYENSEDPPQNSAATDFFNFGNSLTVQGMSHLGAQYKGVC